MEMAAVDVRSEGTRHLRVSRKAAITDGKVVFVDGIPRSGKSLIGPILSSFDRMEIERVEEIFEYVAILHRFGKISTDAAIALVRLESDMQLYNSMIGRNTNIRFTDHSGIWRGPGIWRYLKRLWMKEGQEALERIKQERPIFQNQTHDQLATATLFFEAFGDRFSIVEVIRHPIELVVSWLRRGWGVRYGDDPLAMTICVEHERGDVPFYALGWEEAFLRASPAGRVVRMIESLWRAVRQAYADLTDERKRHILFIPHEEFIQRPRPYIVALEGFLGTRATRRTASILKRQRCPRPYRVEERVLKRDRLLDQLTGEEADRLNRLCRDYEMFAESVR